MSDTAEVENTTESSQPVTRITDVEKNQLDLLKSKRELAVAKANAAVSQSEAAELNYSNLVLRLALKYQLREGDILNDDGTLVRK